MAARVTSMLPAAQRIGFAVHFLEQEIQPLPALPAFFLPDAGLPPPSPSRWRSSSRCERSRDSSSATSMRSANRLASWASRSDSSAPDVIEAAGEGGFHALAQLGGQLLAMLGQQLGQVAFHGLDDAAHAVGALAHHRGQALAFALAAFLQLRQRLLGSLQAGGAPDLGIERVVAALARPVEQFHQAGRGDVRQDSARGLQLLGQFREAGSSRDMSALALRVKDTRISTLPRASCAVSSSRSAFPMAQLVGQAEIQVEEAAVDAAQFERQRALLRSALALPKAVMLRIMVCLSCSLPEGWRVAAACTGRSRARERQYRGRILHAAAFCGVTGQGAGFRPDASPYNAAI